MAVAVACPLSAKQWDAMKLLSDGRTPVEAAEFLMISPASLSGRAYMVRRALHVTTTLAAVEVCREHGWLAERPAEPDGEITPAWRGYLAAFDAHLHAHDDTERHETRLLMDVSLAHALGRPAPTHRRDKSPHLVDAILRFMKENRL